MLSLFLLLLNFSYSQSCIPPIASISGSSTICSGNSATITFIATSQNRGARIYYKVTPGSSTFIDIPPIGITTLNTGPLVTTTTYTLESVEYLTGGGPKCTTAAVGSVQITVNPNATISNPANKTQTVCINAPIAPISFSVGGGGTGASVMGLPNGLNGTYSNGNFTINGTPLSSGSFPYTVTTSGTCSQVTQTGTITVNANATISIPTNKDQTLCINNPISSIIYSIGGGGTGATVSGLPSGLSGNFNSGNFTISGTPTVSGSFTYTVNTTGVCNQTTQTGIIKVNPNATISDPANKTQAVCINTAISQISYLIQGGGTGATVSGLPAGITGVFSGSNLVISGSPTTSGTFNYTVNTTGICIQTSRIGTIIVNPDASINNPANKDQTVCIKNPISTIVYTIGGGATGAAVAGLPTGVTGSFSGNNLTISGTPTISGSFPFTVTTSGSCSQITAQGIISSDPSAVVNAGQDLTICSTAVASLNAVLGGSASSGTWTSNGTGTFSSNSTNTTYTPSISDIKTGSIKLIYTTNDPIGPCNSVNDELILTIQKQIEITSQPQNTELCSASHSQLEVLAIGTGLTYQWYKGSGNGTLISGATSNILKFNNIKPSDQGVYYVIITSDTECDPVRSEEVLVSVEENIIINSQPKNIVTCEGSITNFSIDASSIFGAPIYQWRKDGQNLNDNLRINGAQTPNLTITASSLSDGGNYDVVITNYSSPNCHIATSTSASLNITRLPIVDAGNEISVCENGGSINITSGANASNYSSIEWSSNGSGVISNKNSLTNASYTSGVNDSGFVTLTLSAIGNSPCTPQTATKKILITPKPIISEFYYTTNPFCKSLTTDQQVTLNGKHSFTGGTFSYSSISGGPTLSLNLTTGAINPSKSSPGTYTITYETPANGGCSKMIATTQVIISKTPIADFIYGNGSLCKSSSNPLPSFPTGGAAGIFSSTPDGLNFVSTSTGEIALNTTSPGTYTITNTISANGGCSSVSAQSQVTIHPISIGGAATMNFNNVEEKSILLCHDATNGNISPIKLNGQTGNIVRWEYSINGGAQWIPISNTTATQSYIGIRETRHYRAVVKSGSCSESFSAAAIINIIPPNIVPSPVTATPNVVCLGTSVNLYSQSGYATGSHITTGNFTDSNPVGWRVNGDDKQNFPANGNNTRPNIWSLTNSNKFFTLDGELLFDSNNGKFAVVSGPNSSTMETPVFNTLGLSSAILTFTEAYRLYSNGAQALIELSLDGGVTYNIVLRNLTGATHSGNYSSFNLNARSVNFSDYIGLSNLRIRFKFNGPSGNVWAVDNILLPSKPSNLTTEWVDIITGQVLSTSDTFTVTPNRPGVNTYAVTSSINGCKGGTTYVDVMAYDYDIADAGPDQIVSCGKNTTDLAATLFTAYTHEPKFADGSSGKWTVISGQPSSSYSFSNQSSPTSSFTAQPGNYTLAWAITKAVNSPCQNSADTVTIVFSDCSGLDFDGLDDYIDLGTTYTTPHSLEAWIRPKASFGTIISKRDSHDAGAGYELSLENGFPSFKWNGGSITSSHPLKTNDRWHHIAVSVNGSTAILYIDGIEFARSKFYNHTNSNAPLLIGANYKLTTKTITNHFKGWIEEVRIWKASLTENQIRFMMNQRLYNNGAHMGTQIPLPVPDGLTFDKLAGYYQLIASPANILSGGLTSNLAVAGIHGKLNNMVSFQENTAPLPYTSMIDDQTWATKDTWSNFSVRDFPNSKGIDEKTPINWNIVKTSHNIRSGGKDITLLGLISEGKTLSIENPTSTIPVEDNTGQMLQISHYLKLNGVIDLVGESQLLQNLGSIVDDTSTGYLERDQQGTQSSFNYNYWTSPVSTIGLPNNSGFSIGNILFDGTNSSSPQPIIFGTGPAAADNTRTSPITISSYWLWRFHGASDDYASWVQIKNSGKLKTGEGFTMKGSSGVAHIFDPQNYVFRGKPNNGDITLSINPDENYLIGNPYPSALDAREFILDNLNSEDVTLGRTTNNVFNGALYFWDHFAGKTHNLKGYIGGYAVYNLSGGAPAISTDDRINNNLSFGTKRPGQFIPVGQGFFVNSEKINDSIPVAGGNIIFKNSQRAYVRELDSTSVFLKPNIITKAKSDERLKIRLDFNSPLGYQRQLLVAADPNTTNGFDLGYDAPLIEYNVEDMYWLIGTGQYVIQGVPNFLKDQLLPLGIRVEKEEEFTIKIGELVNMPDSQNIYLRDKVLDTIHDLRKEAYKSTSIVGDIDNRFELIFHKESPPEAENPAEPLTPQEPVNNPIPPDLGLSVRYSHESKEIQILNPLQVYISTVYVFDINGKRLQSFEKIGVEKENRLLLKKYSQGVYIIKIYSDGKLIRKKIIDINK